MNGDGRGWHARIRPTRASALAAVLALACSAAMACSASRPSSPGPGLRGQKLEVAAVWSGVEQQHFELVLRAFTRQTGVAVTYTSAGYSVPAFLAARLARGHPPDVAFLPQPGLLRRYAAEHLLVPLDGVVGSAVASNYSPAWRQLGSVGGRLYGVWFKAANKSLIWYNEGVFEKEGVAPPASVDGLVSLAHRLAGSGVPAFSVGGRDGWTLASRSAVTRCASVSNGRNLAKASPYAVRRPGRQYGRSGHSGDPPRVSLPATRRRSLTARRPSRRAVAPVTTIPFWSWAAVGVMTWMCHRASARASAARTGAGSAIGTPRSAPRLVRAGGLDEFAGAEVELELYRDPGVPDGQPVDGREQLALGEVERGHHDRAASRAGVRAGRGGLARAGLAGGEQREHRPADRQGSRTSPARCSASSPRVTWLSSARWAPCG